MFHDALVAFAESWGINIDYFILWELTVAAGAKSGIYVGGFEVSPEHCEFSKYTFPMTEYKKIVL